jgi:hypothetical protein
MVMEIRINLDEATGLFLEKVALLGDKTVEQVITEAVS